MVKKNNIFVSVVMVADKFTKNSAVRVTKTCDILKHKYSNYEVVLIDNGLCQNEINKLVKTLKLTPCIRVIRLAKCMDIDTALFAGIESAIGDYICTIYNNDPISKIPQFIDKNQNKDIVFGVANNIQRKNMFESWGARIFYWYNRKYLQIDIPHGSTFFMSINRNVANALTRGNRNIKHIRFVTKQVGYESTVLQYSLPAMSGPYMYTKNSRLLAKAIELVSSNSDSPLRMISYLGIAASLLNVIYAIYVIFVNITRQNIEKGWTTLSLQSSLMFFILFLLLTMISEYIGKILVESRNDPPYNIMQELSSTISLADETRRNVTK